MQAQACSAPTHLGREKGRKYLALQLRRNALAVIGDGDADPARLWLFCLDMHGAMVAVFKSVQQRIGNQVGQRLPQWAGITVDIEVLWHVGFDQVGRALEGRMQR